MKFMLYAEGPGDRGPNYAQELRPGSLLPREWEGVAHLVTRRAFALASSVPAAAVEFVSPLRTRQGRVPTGSELHVEQTLRHLLTLVGTEVVADAVIVIVDQDGDPRRKQRLVAALSGRSHIATHVVAVAIQEFETWLIADTDTVKRVLRVDVSLDSNPESLLPRGCKDLWTKWCREHSELSTDLQLMTETDARLKIAQACDLEVVRSRCNAFASFFAELRSLARSLGHS